MQLHNILQTMLLKIAGLDVGWKKTAFMWSENRLKLFYACDDRGVISGFHN